MDLPEKKDTEVIGSPTGKIMLDPFLTHFTSINFRVVKDLHLHFL